MLDIYNDKYSYIIILNCLEEIIFCNKNFLNRLNYSSGEILNSNIKKIIISEKNIMATLRKKDSWDYGGAYMRGTNCNILKIRNKNSLSDKKVLVFRDSYQAPMTWLLADVFKEVEIIDPRYIENIDMTYEDMIVNSKSDIVMFMYNSFGFEGMIKEMIEKGIE